MTDLIPNIVPGAEPFLMDGGSAAGALLVHGLSASPNEMVWLGRYLAAQGLTVHGVRLHGHGSRYEEVTHSRWEDWYGSVADGYALMKARCDQVFVLGLSLGGLLGLLLASQVQVAGLAVMASPLNFDNRLIPLSRYLRYVMPTASRFDRNRDPLFARVKQLQRERGEPEHGRVAHYRISTGALAQLVELQGIVMQRLATITAPTVAIYSEADATAPVGNLDRLTQGLIAVSRLESHILTKSDHVLTQDTEQEAVFEICWSFIRRICDHHD